MGSPIFTSLRPKEWYKNLLIFIPLIASDTALLTSWPAWVYVVIAFIAFCGISGSVYILNDLLDLSKDRIHPVNCQRPLASGQLSIKDAKVSLLLILVTSLFIAWKISGLFLGISLGYFMLNLAYSFKLKKIIPLDVIIISSGYVLRTLAGVGALKFVNPHLEISHWFVLIPFMFAMVGALEKRRKEIIYREESGIVKIGDFQEYSLEFLDRGITIFSSLSIGVFCFFTINPDVISKYGSSLVYTNIIVAGVFLYRLYCMDKTSNS